MTLEKWQRQWLIIGLFVVGVPFFALVGFCFYGFYLISQPNGTVEELKSDAEKRIPLGSSRQQVDRWLESWDIRPNDIVHSDTGRWCGYGATIPINEFLVGTAQIRIALYFDNKERLERRIIYLFVFDL